MEKTSSTIIDKAEEIGVDVLDRAIEISKTVIEKANTMADGINNSQNKPHKIIMLGGRRSGKSSVLACIIDQLENNTSGNICTAMQVDQGHLFYDENKKSYTMPILSNKKLEIESFISLNSKLSNSLFVVDMGLTQERGSYYVQIKTGGSAAMTLEFVDVRGEAMMPKDTLYPELQKDISESDVFIITVDTPFLMEMDDSVNMTYNRISEITSSMQNIKIDENDKWDKKLILFCPVKCEKWLNEGYGELIADKICKSYSTLINSWVQHPNITIWIMPVETAGGIEFSKFMDPKIVFKSDNDRMGTSCSVNDRTNTIHYRDGRTEQISDKYRFVPDKGYQQQFDTKFPIPLPWYKSNGKGFSPRLCEQPAYHILRFLAEKEKLINNLRQKKNDNVGWFMKFLMFLRGYVSPFGKYAQEFSAMVDQISSQGLIKESGDGFRKLTTPIINTK